MGRGTKLNVCCQLGPRGLACATQNPARPLPLARPTSPTYLNPSYLRCRRPPRLPTAAPPPVEPLRPQLASADAFKDPARMLRFDEAWAALEEALTSATNSDLESQMAADVSGLHEAWKASGHIAAFSVGIGRRRR